MELLAPVRNPWWVSGGWAIDLWLGERTRLHDDFDVGCTHRDTLALLGSLRGWEVYAANHGRLKLAPEGEALAGGGLWLRRKGAAAWDIQCPEVQLLYKAKDVRRKDHHDFDAVLPTLEPEQRAWLARALGTLHPSHEWIGRIG